MYSSFRHKASNDDGFTLVEVLVALMLLAVLSTIIATIAINSTKANGKVSQRARVQSQLNDALTRVSNHIGQADDFTVTGPLELVTTETDPDAGMCTLIRYKVTSNQALAVSRATCSATPVWSTPDPVVDHLNTVGSPFTYYDKAGLQVSPATPALVQRVKVTLAVGNQTMTSSTALREADDIQLGG